MLPGAVLAGRYRLERLIGSGTSGRVWVAHDEVLRRRVAIKTVDLPAGLPRAEAEQIGDRTLREARAIGRLSNPHVVTLYDIITLSSGPAIVMELLDARPLSAILATQGPLADGAAATVGLAVSAGLMAAHDAGITHRDVKPGNVLVATDGRIKITDFGIARSVGEHTITATGMLLGSPAYIAPEVATGHPATPAADAWGLGALLYACVEGRPPYDRGNAIATLTSVVTDPVPPHPRAGRIAGVIDGLLVKDPRHRLGVRQAHDALRMLADDPVGLRLGRRAPAVDRPGRPSADGVVWPTTEVPGGPSADGSGGPSADGSGGSDGPRADGSGGPDGPTAKVAGGRHAERPIATGPVAPGPDLGPPTGGRPEPPVRSSPPDGVSSGTAPPDLQGATAAGPPAPDRNVVGARPSMRTTPLGRPGADPAGGRAMPPPPWTPGSADALRPIPAVAPRTRRPWLLVLAVVLVAAGVALGYFAVLAIANLG